jgi:hypothetical protein
MLFGGADPTAAGQKIDSGNHADLIRVMPENGSIRVSAIKELIEKLRMKPFSSDRLFAVIEDSDLMNAQAQNKLLKTLEEPAGNNVIMLLAANTEALRATIRSRCMKLNLGYEAADIERTVRDDAVKLLSAALFGKPLNEAFAVSDTHVADPFPLLDAMELFLRDIIVGGLYPGLVTDDENRVIADKMKDKGYDDALLTGIGVIEDTRTVLRLGRMNAKNSLRDMALRLRKY